MSQARRQGLSRGVGGSLTFSRPKNLSVPSSRTGPAFCSIFSRGVISGGGSSATFFLLTASGFVVAWADVV